MLRLSFPYIAAGAGICFLGYCIYFDRKRRSHPEFRERLRKIRMEQALENEKKSSIPMPTSTDPAAMQNYFLNHIQKGETSLSLGLVDEAIQEFAIAISSCPQPSQILQVLQQSLSPTVFLKLIEVLPEIQSKFKSMLAKLNPTVKEIEEELE